MTKTKAKRLIDELIVKFGDVVVAKTYDYWASKTYVKEGEDTNTIMAEIHLSEIEPPCNRSDFKKLEDVVRGKEKITYIPVEVAESKAVYDSPEQAELRRVHKDYAQRRVRKFAQHLLPYCRPLDTKIFHRH